MRDKLNNPRYHNTITDCDGTNYVLVTTPDNPVINLFVFIDDVSNLQLLEATMFIDHHNGDPNNPGPMIEWDESVLIRPEVVKWFVEEGEKLLKINYNN